MYLADAFSDLLYIPFKVHIYILSVFVFPGNQTHDFGAAGALLYSLRKAANY